MGWAGLSYFCIDPQDLNWLTKCAPIMGSVEWKVLTQNANFNNLEKSNTALKLKKMTQTQFFFLFY